MPSSRATGSRYGMYGYEPISPTGGGGGGTSLVDILTGNTPSKLAKQQFGFEKDLQEMLHRHELEKIKIANDSAKSGAFRAHFLEQMKSVPGALDVSGNPTPAGDEWLKHTALELVKNKTQEAQMEGLAMQDPSAQQAVTKKFLAQQQQPDVANRLALTAKANQGETVFTPGGQTGQDTTTRGATPKQSVSMVGGFPFKLPDGSSIMAGQQPAISSSFVPGNVIQGNSRISPDDMQNFRGGNANPQINFNKQSPVGDQSSPFGQQSAPPNSNIIPSMNDILGNAAQPSNNIAQPSIGPSGQGAAQPQRQNPQATQYNGIIPQTYRNAKNDLMPQLQEVGNDMKIPFQYLLQKLLYGDQGQQQNP